MKSLSHSHSHDSMKVRGGEWRGRLIYNGALPCLVCSQTLRRVLSPVSSTHPHPTFAAQPPSIEFWLRRLKQILGGGRDASMKDDRLRLARSRTSPSRFAAGTSTLTKEVATNTNDSIPHSRTAAALPRPRPRRRRHAPQHLIPQLRSLLAVEAPLKRRRKQALLLPTSTRRPP